MLEADFKYIIDTFFTLFCMVLIIFMVPGFAMLEAGLVRTKNVSSVLTINVMIYAVASLAFLLVGYCFAFGSWENSNMSMWAAFLFQMAFVGKTINIMSGGVSERVRIIPLAIFAVIMGAFIYPAVVNVSWGADFLAGTFLDINMHDLAGSTVIHSTGGWALLAAILIIGSRKGRYVQDSIRVIPASNIPLVVLGAFLLWIGWFGFNGGSVGSISSVENANSVAKTIMNTNTAGLAGAIIAGILMYVRYKLFDITMILNGALGGLVAITAGPDLFNMYLPILIGAIGGALVVFAVPLFDKFKLDDPVGALSVHLVNGIWGTLAVGIFIEEISFMDQLKGVVIVGVFAFSVSYVLIYIINRITQFRATDDAQQEGMDINECGVESYPEFKRAI
ncbi:MAG: ammonium transporter [Epsilonproteobacteria bacterium]|nr:ammonium transporter [Campylobacterota bacterium]OIO17245.1 MAG: ammonium transporter [Helicobacteraceae bacterium CG1_02_36_14]PIP10050.1 MAG: ammonium transporter [Sulfurimonas sp. CG23_combo_of_CG06-09_8_20_14_all_36_33]PIS23646.1 MAG: ammonium transporter [Sulfurimonas sp. CG08_land_8_20_14_0_20_36_33]PIU34851.1 MAG: ammonium transporter [Sulfurimonas sp. CG07_land_8_20_14_0_80_36_56]PIV05101.1 MAG: ammonium transporter [Sulfurimonas sp. CG03_land_8_20_14_0_80_36_25]PIV34876.1 MAG: amm